LCRYETQQQTEEAKRSGRPEQATGLQASSQTFANDSITCGLGIIADTSANQTKQGTNSMKTHGAKKTVLITGTSSGLGKTAARLFASSGWNVIATMRNPEAGMELAGLGDVFVSRLDVQDRASIVEAIAAGVSRFGRIDALVNNAGFGRYGLFESTPREKIQQQFDVNVFGIMLRWRTTIHSSPTPTRFSQAGSRRQLNTTWPRSSLGRLLMEQVDCAMWPLLTSRR
jgi:hypothetical protein